MQHHPTKVALSKYELELVTNAQILLTKNEIIKKVCALFGLMANEFVPKVQDILPAEVTRISPKISKGENYEGLPYVMLDYPRYFKKDEAFAIRTFFWWGNFFSITLQLAGQYKHQYLSKLQQNIRAGTFDNWYINVGNNEWDHHYRECNYRLLQLDDELEDKRVIKLSTKIPLIQWDEVQLYLSKSFKKTIDALS
jgi:hypothetical protein